MPKSKIRTYDHTARALAFPLGGIGTGNVSLGARGDLRDWEIFNHPGKGFNLPNTFFALRIQVQDGQPIMRVVEGPIQPPYDQSHGFHPLSNAGLPRFNGTTFRGEYPFAWIDYEDTELPVEVSLEGFTPFIPLNPQDSGIPGAILTFHIQNRIDTSVELTLVASILNPVGGIQFDPFGNIMPNTQGKSVNQVWKEENLQGLHLTASGISPDEMLYGNISLATTSPNITIKPVWLRGRWYDFLREFWDDLAEDGCLTDLSYTEAAEDGRPDTASLGVLDALRPGESGTYRFLLTWFFPNRLQSWRMPGDFSPEQLKDRLCMNNYATRFKDSWAVARYLIQEMPRLENETRKFHQALFTSTYPPEILDAISANIVPLRSPTCFWLDDGRFYGWEGCFDTTGCCAGSCTHVWSYAQTLAFLFPSLERSMRSTEFIIETDETGFMNFRNLQSLGDPFVWGNQKPHAAVDGQMGSILRSYREWLLSADRPWLESIWPGIKRAIAFAGIHWDQNQDGVLDGIQHNTYDIEFHGPNPLCGIYYLGALRAVEELAQVMAEPDLAARARMLYERGSQNLDEFLWNGSYYIQHLDDVDSYPYQHGTGCLSDQLLGQLHARILDLGDLLPAEHVRTALQSIFQNNFQENFRHHANFQRTYVLNDESGLVLCTWPNGGKPRFPFVYSDEVWTGIEYQVASHLIYEGFLEQALTMVRAARARHDGHRRNPWDEVECGHHYARSMSSWSLLLALSGYHCDLDRGEMRFAPVLDVSPISGTFKTFWSNAAAWGTYLLSFDEPKNKWHAKLEILGGDLDGVEVYWNLMKIS